jgi:hypothetical protein
MDGVKVKTVVPVSKLFGNYTNQSMFHCCRINIVFAVFQFRTLWLPACCLGRHFPPHTATILRGYLGGGEGVAET